LRLGSTVLKRVTAFKTIPIKKVGG